MKERERISAIKKIGGAIPQHGSPYDDDLFHQPKTVPPQPEPRRRDFNDILEKKIVKDTTKEPEE